MSSMGRAALILPILLACSASASAQIPSAIASTAAAAAAAVTDNINYSIADWRRLRQGGNFSFTDYARFLNYNHDWPGEASMRRAAERAMQPGEHASLVLGF